MTLLDDREKRYYFQKDLCKKFQKTLIVIKPNYPGNNKNTLMTTYLTTYCFFELNKYFDIIIFYATSTTEGLIYYLVVEQAPQEVKKITIKYESTRLGRLLDIDVYNQSQAFTRKQLNYANRKCYICDLDAKYCIKKESHTLEKLQSHFNWIVLEDMKIDTIKKISLYALVNELNKEIECGCVSFRTNGSHLDMNYKTYLSSIEVIINNVTKIKEINSTDFNSLRQLGCLIEDEMFKATNNINTHKGSIFILLLLLAGIINVEYQNISTFIKELCVDIYDDFTKFDSNGVNIYQKTKIKGIREQAYNGFELLFKYNDEDFNNIFFDLIKHVDDTTIIKRSSLEQLKKVQQLAKNIIGVVDMKKFDEYCLDNKISCGGSADMLMGVLLLNIIKKLN